MASPTWMTLMGRIERDLSALERHAAIPLEEMPDLCGRMRAFEVKAGNMRRAWTEEQVLAAKDPEHPLGPDTFPAEERPYGGTVKPRVVGKEYRTVTTRSCSRTYSTAPLLMGITEAEGFDSPLDALMYAIGEAGLAKLEWRWKPLLAYSQRHGLPLKTVPHQIPDDGDLDGPWVGETWKETATQEAIPQGGAK